jgi:hypothetical protein
VTETNPGVFFEVSVDGKIRSYRDRRETAIGAGAYLRRMAPTAKVEVRDTRDGSIIIIDEKYGG